MILAIRISGRVETTTKVEETLFRLRLRRKYSATLLADTPENRTLLRSVRSFIAYGSASDATLVKLVEARGQPTDKSKKVDADKVVKHLTSKGFEDSGIRPFFRLHPPRKGIDSKLHVGVKKGVLGDNKEAINALVERML